MVTKVNIDKASLAYLQIAVKTAEMLKIDSIIIEPGRVRAIDDNNSVVILQTKKVPDMPFGSIGLNRLNVFSARLDLIKNADSNFEVEALVETLTNKDTDEQQNFARSLIFKGKDLTIEYRCANPALLKAPRNINDTVYYSIKLSPEATTMLLKGHSAMGCEDVTFVGSKQGVEIQMLDNNGDIFNCKVANENDIVIYNQAEEFDFKYSIKTLLPLFKINPNTIEITAKGIMKIEIYNLDVYILPRI